MLPVGYLFLRISVFFYHHLNALRSAGCRYMPVEGQRCRTPSNCFLPEGVETPCLQLVPFLLAGTLRYDKGIRLQRDVGNCPRSTTDVIHVPSSQRQLSSMIGSVTMRLCHFHGAPLCPEGQTFWLRHITVLPHMETGLSNLPI